MADIAILRAEIKAWEQSFKENCGRAATVDDVRKNGDMAAKYKLYKRLCKVAINPTTVQNSKGESSPPTTPPRTSRLKSPTSALLSRSSLVESTAPLTSYNPFSPKKTRMGKEREQCLDVGDTLHKFSRSGSASSSEGPSQSPIPIYTSSHSHSSEFFAPPEPTTAVSRARKRLRGEPVSPSPNKDKRRRVYSQNTNAFPRMNTKKDNELEMSDPDSCFVDNSPLKVSAGGKIFPKLFTQSSLPATDLFGIKPQRGGPVKTSSQLAINPTSQKRSRDDSLEFSSAQIDMTGRVRNETPSTNSVSHVANSSDDMGNSSYPPMRPKSPLLPPSPPLSATLPYNRSSHPKKTVSKMKKKVLLDDDSSTSDTDEAQMSSKLKIVKRQNIPAAVRDEGSEWDSDPITNRTRSREPRAASPDTTGGHVEVNLPDKLRQVLALESIASQASEDDIVKDLLYGRRAHYYFNKGGEVWDIGEDHLISKGEGHRNEEDWEGEPVPWEIAEL